MNELEKIGFYTLSDERAANASKTSQLMRCEMVLTSRCNFKCPYCRSVGGHDMDFELAMRVLKDWCLRGNLKNVRFSGGEPTLYPHLTKLVSYCKSRNVERIAISTNGSASMDYYRELIEAGANDFSVSLDACCAEDGDHMTGGIKGAFDHLSNNIRELSKLTYVTVGVVLTANNAEKVNEIVKFADSLGVSDVRVIPAAQDGDRLGEVSFDQELLDKYPILKYRFDNIREGRPVRGLHDGDSKRCGLVVDDMAVNHQHHYPCIIYMREGGNPIGTVHGDVREERWKWYLEHDVHTDPICKKNCLDVCVDHNKKFEALNRCARKS